MVLHLSNFFQLTELNEYKLHLATWNGENQPLDAFIRDRKEWDGWNSYRKEINEFNRDYILALIDFYPQPGVWLFGGVYRVLYRGPERNSHSYKIERTNFGEELVGRLKIKFQRPGRKRSLRLENYFDQLEVAALLEEPYSGEPFPGYENIRHDFSYLETVILSGRPDWKAALENVKGVYVIFDKSNGKKYVGAAYGETGVWSRWSDYIGTGHGWNNELTKLIDKKGISYARENFVLTLLEYRPAKTDDRLVQEREEFWKQALLSRAFGYNQN